MCVEDVRDTARGEESVRGERVGKLRDESGKVVGCVLESGDESEHRDSRLVNNGIDVNEQ